MAANKDLDLPHPSLSGTHERNIRRFWNGIWEQIKVRCLKERSKKKDKQRWIRSEPNGKDCFRYEPQESTTGWQGNWNNWRNGRDCGWLTRNFQGLCQMANIRYKLFKNSKDMRMKIKIYWDLNHFWSFGWDSEIFYLFRNPGLYRLVVFRSCISVV